MRLFFLSLLSAVAFVAILNSCVTDDNSTFKLSDSVQKSHILYQQWENNTVVFNKTDRNFYGIEHIGMLKMPQSIVALTYSKGKIELESSNGQSFVFTANETKPDNKNEIAVLGISSFSGPY